MFYHVLHDFYGLRVFHHDDAVPYAHAAFQYDEHGHVLDSSYYDDADDLHVLSHLYHFSLSHLRPSESMPEQKSIGSKLNCHCEDFRYSGMVKPKIHPCCATLFFFRETAYASNNRSQ